MPVWSNIFIISLFVNIILGSKYFNEPCDRIRRPLHLLSDEEKILYVEGIQKLRENKVLNKISLTHGNPYTNHFNGDFLFWHEYIVWEVETQIRALGSKFKCFAMPYYDFTIDSGNENNPFIYTDSLLGGNGDINNNLCVKSQTNNINNTNLWSIDRYTVTTEELCTPYEIYPNCCLKRAAAASTSSLIPTSANMASAILESTFQDFQTDLLELHGYVHTFFGGMPKHDNSHTAMSGSWAADDPIFWVLHSYITMIRLLWTSCWNYDMIDVHQPDFWYQDPSFLEAFCDSDLLCPDIKWNYNLDFYPLNTFNWSLTNKMEIPLKAMYNPIDWGIKFELGTVLDSMHLNEWCKNINDNWFIKTNTKKVENIRNNYKSNTQKYIDSLWDEWYNGNDDMTASEMYGMADSLSCKYNRKYSENSCWDEDIMGDIDQFQIETCNDRNIENINDLSLDYILNFDGVKDNECLTKIRKQMYNAFFAFGDDVNLRICNGDFDYKCKQFRKKNDNELVNDINIMTIKERNARTVNYMLLFILSATIAVIFCWCHNSMKIKSSIHHDKNFKSYSTF